ncbi:MAG: tetratricopeptide repeat protein [Myxococcota bacterium]
MSELEGGDDLPTLLILGDGEPLRPGIEDALTRHATFAEAADKGSAVAAVQAAAPDVVLLLGDAAERAEEVLGDLASNAITRTVPVVVLLEAGDLAARLQAARSGVAVVERSASADAVAKEIAHLARAFPERDTNVAGELGEATLGDVLDIVRRELETGILSVHQQGGKGARFVLRQGRHVDQAIRDFVARIRPLVAAAEPLQFDYDEAVAGFELLDSSTEEGDRSIFEGRRVALVEDDAAVADAIAQELRAHGAQVTVLSSSGAGLARARHLDPEIVLVGERGLDGPAYEVLRKVRADPRLRWASLLVIRGDDLMPEGHAPRMDRLAGAFAPLLAPDEEVRERAKGDEPFDTRFEALGPSRLLRALIDAGGTHVMTVRHPRVTIDVSISQGMIAGADAIRTGKETKISGPAALAALLAIGSGRVRVEKRSAPAAANVFMPLQAALEAASQESPPIRPSVLPASFPSRPSSPPEGLLTELESVLEKLRNSGMLDGRPSLAPAEAAARVEPPQKPPAKPPSDPPTKKRPSLRPSRFPPPPPPPRVKRPPKPGTPSAIAKPAAAKPKPKPSAAKPARRKSRTLLGTGDGILKKDLAESRPLDASALIDERPSGPPVAGLSVETRRTTEGSVSVAKFVLPRNPEIIEKDRRAQKKTPLATPAAMLPQPQDDPTLESAALELGNDQNDLRPSDPDGVDEVTVDVALPEIERLKVGSTQRPSEPPAPLHAAMDAMDEPDDLVLPKSKSRAPILAVLLVLLCVGGGFAFWAMQGEDVATLEDEPRTARAQAGEEPPSRPTHAEPTNAQPAANVAVVDEDAGIDLGEGEAGDETGVEEGASEADASTDDTGAAPDAGAEDSGVDLSADEEEPAELNAEGQGSDESEDGAPGENASRAEIIAWNLQSGNFHRNREHYRVARRRYRRVLRMAPRNGRALAGMARIAIAQNRGQDAVDFARRLVRVNPTNAGNRVLLGDAFRVVGDQTRAQAQYREALRINPRHRGAQRRLR